MQYHEVVSGLTVTTIDNMWLIEAHLNDDGSTDGKIHPVIALQSKVIHDYDSAIERITAPHHSELTKNGWTYRSTHTVIDLVILVAGRLILASGLEYGPGIAHKTVVGLIPNQNDISDLLEELKVERDERRARESLKPDTKPNLQHLFLKAVDHYHNARTDVERARIMTNMMGYRPTDSFQQFVDACSQVGISLPEVISSLGLNMLTLGASQQMREGAICIANAHALAKLPATNQSEWIFRCCSQQPSEVVPFILAKADRLERERIAAKNKFINARTSNR